MSVASVESSRPLRRAAKPRAGQRTAVKPPSPVRREQAVLLYGDWARYKRLDAELTGTGVRVSYFHGVIEIMSISPLHEVIKSNIGRLIENFCFERGKFFGTRGGPTHKKKNEQAGEPDESYIFERGREMPQLVIEVALSSGGLDKLAFWGGFPIDEVWIWKKRKLVFFRWQGDAYVEVKQSKLVPGFKAEWAERFAECKETSDMLREFRKLL